MSSSGLGDLGAPAVRRVAGAESDRQCVALSWIGLFCSGCPARFGLRARFASRRCSASRAVFGVCRCAPRLESGGATRAGLVCACRAVPRASAAIRVQSARTVESPVGRSSVPLETVNGPGEVVQRATVFEGLVPDWVRSQRLSVDPLPLLRYHTPELRPSRGCPGLTGCLIWP